MIKYVNILHYLLPKYYYISAISSDFQANFVLNCHGFLGAQF